MINRTTAALVLGFIIVSVLLSLFGLIDIRTEDVFGYAIIILGLSLVYPAFKTDQKLMVFVGSGIFLTGMAMLVFGSFELNANEKFITPLLLIIMGISLFMVYISDTSRKLFFIISMITATSGVVLLYFQKPFGILKLIQSVIPVLGTVWPIFLILVVIAILIRRSD